MTLVKGLGDMPAGGQIVMEETAFDNIKTHLAELCEKIPKDVDFEAMEANCRCNMEALHAFWINPTDCVPMLRKP